MDVRRWQHSYIQLTDFSRRGSSEKAVLEIDGKSRENKDGGFDYIGPRGQLCLTLGESHMVQGESRGFLAFGRPSE